VKYTSTIWPKFKRTGAISSLSASTASTRIYHYWPSSLRISSPPRSAAAAVHLLSREFHAVKQCVDHDLTEAVIATMCGRQYDLVEAGVWDRVLGGLVKRHHHSLGQVRRTSHEPNQIRHSFVLCSRQFSQNKIKNEWSSKANRRLVCIRRKSEHQNIQFWKQQ